MINCRLKLEDYDHYIITITIIIVRLFDGLKNWKWDYFLKQEDDDTEGLKKT